MADLRSEFVDAPLWQKFLLVGLGTFLLFYFVYQTFFKDLWHNYRNAGKELQAIEYNIRTSNIIIKDLPLLQKKKKLIQKKLNRYLPSEKRSTYLFSTLVKKNGLSLLSLKPLATESQQFWTKHRYSILLSGSLSAFQNFLKKLSSSSVAHQINSLQLQKKGTKYSIIFDLDLYSIPDKLYKARQVTKRRSALTLQGFWNKGGVSKAFINNKLVGLGEHIGNYRLISISEKYKTAVVRGLKTNRKYTLKVLK